MSAEEILLTLIAVLVVGAVVALANVADQRNDRRLRLVLVCAWSLLNLLILMAGVMQVVSAYAANSTDAPSKMEGWGGLATSVVVFGAASLVLLYPVRLKLMVLFPPHRKRLISPEPGLVVRNVPAGLSPDLQPKPDNPPLFPQMLNYYTADSLALLRSSASQAAPTLRQAGEPTETHGFNPDSNVHTAALVLCLYLVGTQIFNFIVGGGMEGVAESYQGGLTAWDLLVNACPFVVIPVLGVGLGMRRNIPQTLKRLGLGIPSFEGLMVSSAATVGLFIFVVMLTALWMGLVSEDTFKKQTEASDAISQSISTLGLAFLLAATAAVGEEIAFRGALQPIFGLWPTAILFTMTHIQYTLTPAALIILGVALVFGWIRQRYNTTVAMVVHFLYDFIPLAVGVAVSEGALTWLLKLI